MESFKGVSSRNPPVEHNVYAHDIDYKSSKTLPQANAHTLATRDLQAILHLQPTEKECITVSLQDALVKH